ncbi:MAG: hypothetical protein RR439_00895 [Carnobacterium sp.]
MKKLLLATTLSIFGLAIVGCGQTSNNEAESSSETSSSKKEEEKEQVEYKRNS